MVIYLPEIQISQLLLPLHVAILANEVKTEVIGQTLRTKRQMICMGPFLPSPSNFYFLLDCGQIVETLRAILTEEVTLILVIRGSKQDDTRIQGTNNMELTFHIPPALGL